MKNHQQLKIASFSVDDASNSGPLIDHYFDASFANDIAELESYNKNLYRPNTYLHKWWARRCGSTFRLILKHLVQDEEKQGYYTAGGLEGKTILDPMMGGATTLHEAIRLGANVVGADIDPIPILQARASLSNIPLDNLESEFDKFYNDLTIELSPLFRTKCPECGESTDIQFTLYGLQRKCKCGQVLFIDSTILRHEQDGSVIRICPKCHSILYNAESCKCDDHENKPPLIEKGIMSCKTCGEHYSDELDKPYYLRYTPLVIVGKCTRHGLFYKSPAKEDLLNIATANSRREKIDFSPLSDFEIEHGPKSNDLIKRRITSYTDLFSSRQLIYISTAIELLPKYSPLIRLNLALLISTSLDFNSMLCGYKGSNKNRPGAIRHTFSHHAYSFPYTALENNPIYGDTTSGTLQKLFDSGIRRGRQWALNPVERIKGALPKHIVIKGEIDAGEEVKKPSDLFEGTRKFLLIQGSSTTLNLDSDCIDYVITDPPYFDSVQYSDLAAYFRVWLRRLIPSDIGWDYDYTQSAVESNGSGNGQYNKVLRDIFIECHRVLNKKKGRLVFTFHHWNPKGWAALTCSLKKANFVLLNRYVVHSENPISVHISNLKALTDDAILVLAPKEVGISYAWELPLHIDSAESFNFCQDCATALGYMLNSDLSEKEICDKWCNLIK